MIWTRYFSSPILNRGRIYWNNGRVGKLQMPDDETCTAVVRGTHPYHVSTRLLPNDSWNWIAIALMPKMAIIASMKPHCCTR